MLLSFYVQVVTPVNHENPLTWPPMPITLSFGDLAFSATVLYAPNTSLVNSLMEDINETFAKDSLEGKVVAWNRVSTFWSDLPPGLSFYMYSIKTPP